MKPCEVCGKSHHLHTENDLSNCLVWANDENRELKAEIERLRDIIKRMLCDGTAKYAHWLHMKHYYGADFADLHEPRGNAKCQVCRAIYDAEQALAGEEG